MGRAGGVGTAEASSAEKARSGREVRASELAILLRDVEKAVRRLGEAYRAKRRGDAEDGAAAEFTALTHLAEARKIVEGR